MSNIKQLLVGVMIYADDFDGQMPTWDYPILPELGLTRAAWINLSYSGSRVLLGKLYPRYIPAGGTFYCPSPTGIPPSSFQYIETGAAGGYHFRGTIWSLAPLQWVRILQDHPDWIILSDMGYFRYADGSGGIVNHPGSDGLPEYFNNGWADGHVSSYLVKNRAWYPVVSSGDWSAYGMDLMQSNQW